MGAQIAAHLANSGMPVLLYDLAVGNHPNLLAEQAIEALKSLKPNPLVVDEAIFHIHPANYAEHLPQLTTCDWIIEAISDRPDWKKSLYEKIIPHITPEALFTTNTTGLSIQTLADFLPKSLKKRFFGTHFFNPPRYMRLVELIAHTTTDNEQMQALEAFLVSRLGKGVIMARDTPHFIGNRLGVFCWMSLLRHADALYIAPEIVDALTGPLLGRQPSATYRALDIIGLDTLSLMVNTLEKGLGSDPWRDYFQLPDWINTLILKGALGQKTHKGIYEKRQKELWVYDAEQETYRLAQRKPDPDILDILKKPWSERVCLLKDNPHPQAQFLWTSLNDLWDYASYHLKTIANTTHDVDLAFQWGYGWDKGPFECQQEAYAAKIHIPPWEVPLFENEAVRFMEKEGVGVAWLKTPFFTPMLLEGLQKALAISEQHAHPLVIAQGEGADFSLGSVIKKETASTWMALRYSAVPVVVAVKGSVLGWGCELMFHADHVVAALESYISPVSTKMPFPVGGGTKELVLRAYQNSLIFGQRLDWLEKFFKQILKGQVSGSALDARKLSYLKESDIIVSQTNEVLSCAILQAKTYHQRGYAPPLETICFVEGRSACQHLKTLVWNMKKQHFISEQTAHQAEQWVTVLAGGFVEAGTQSSETHLLALERRFWSEVMRDPTFAQN